MKRLSIRRAIAKATRAQLGERVTVRCERCARARRVDPGLCALLRWPTCCGLTMTVEPEPAKVAP